MARQKKQTVIRNFDLYARSSRAYVDVVQGVAATVTFTVEVGTFHSSDTIKVQISAGNGTAPFDFASAKALSNSTTAIFISEADMAGVSQLAITRNGANTSVDPTRGTLVITQDLET